MRKDKEITLPEKTEDPSLKNEEEPEVKKIRHTISAEETFTLAKDIFDIRTYLKRIYDNRAVIAKRFNNLSLIVSVVYTVLYTTFILVSGVYTKLSLGFEIATAVVIALFTIFLIVLLFVLFGKTDATKSEKKSKKLKVLRYLVKIFSLVMSVFAVVTRATDGSESTVRMIIDTSLIVFSVFNIVIQGVQIAFGGLAGLARWALSPVKVKARTNTVAVEWYRLVISSNRRGLIPHQVAGNKIEDVGRAIDDDILPYIGKKWINSVTVDDVLSVVNNSAEEKRELVEGTLKNIFEYAFERGYVAKDVCADLELSVSIEEPVKEKRKTIGDKIKEKGFSLIKSAVGFGSDDEKDKKKA